MSEELNYKICVVGPEKAGKTSLVNRIAVGSFKDGVINETLTKKYITVAGNPVCLDIYECIDRKEKELRKFYQGADCILFVVSLEDIESLCLIPNFVEEAEKMGVIPSNSFLVATKSDGYVEVEEYEAEKMASDIQLKYIKVSSRTAFGFESLLFEIQNDIFSILKKKASEQIEDDASKKLVCFGYIHYSQQLTLRKKLNLSFNSSKFNY